MQYDRDKILEHWNKDDVESMYDKHLLHAEIELIKRRISPNTKILDAGCGEGEGTLAYAAVPGVVISAADFSETRLIKAKERLKDHGNVTFHQIDFSENYSLDPDFDIIISQRFIINFTDWQTQQRVIRGLLATLRPGGILLMLEGCRQGMDALNEFRAAWGLAPIPAKWHNLFLDDQALIAYMQEQGCRLIDEDGLGVYFMLTRGIRPIFDNTFEWACEFNRIASTKSISDMIGLGPRLSRLKLWVFQKA